MTGSAAKAPAFPNAGRAATLGFTAGSRPRSREAPLRPVRAFLAALFPAIVVAGASAQVNRCLFFGPGSGVQVPASPSIDAISGAITIEAWVMLDGTSIYPTVMRRAISASPATEASFALGIAGGVPGGGGNNPLSFWVKVGPDFFGQYTTFQLITPVSLFAFEWHHVAATFDGIAMRLYWDGAQTGFAVHPGSLAATSAPVFLGNGTGTDSWAGRIDDLRLWSVARSANEIDTFRFAPLAGNEPGLVANWRFDESSGQTASDATANGNDGILGTLPILDPADPTWTASTSPIGAFVASITPTFGPFYASNPVVVSGQGFTPGASVLSIGGVPVAGATVVDAQTITAIVPPGAAGPGDVSVSSLYGPASLPDGWTWADHLYATGGISTVVGGSVVLSLYAEPANALHAYLVLTSLSGTSPGVPLPGSALVLPLNPDVWTTIGLLQTNTPTFSSFFGVLSAQGTASASLNLGPIPVLPAPIGLPIDFAYLVVDPFGGGFTLASNAVSVPITP